MGTLTIEHANAMPAPTWHRLHMNDADIELPGGLAAAQQVEVSCEEGLRGEADAFDRALRSMADPLPAADQGLSPVEPASVPTSAAHQVDDQAAPPAAMEGGATAMEDGALSLYQQQALENLYLAPSDVFTTGMGDEAREYLEFVAGEPIVFATRPGERTCATVRVEGVDGAANAAAIDVVAAPGSSLSLAVALDSPAPGAGL